MNPYNMNLLKKYTRLFVKTPEQIQKQGTRGLLTYYKRFHGYDNHYIGLCECCGNSLSDLYASYTNYEEDEPIESHKTLELAQNEFEKYKQFIKEELNTREHVKKKVKKENPDRRRFELKRHIKNYKLYNLNKKELTKVYEDSNRFNGRTRFPFEYSLTEVLSVCENIKFGLLSATK